MKPDVKCVSINAEDCYNCNEDIFQDKFASIAKATVLIRKEIASGLNGPLTERMAVLMSLYVSAVREEFNSAKTSPYLCQLLSVILKRTTCLIQTLSNSLHGSTSYTSGIGEITSLYISSELCGARESGEHKDVIAARITHFIKEFVLANADIDSHEMNLLRVFIGIPEVFDERQIMLKLYSHFMPITRDMNQRELPDKIYMQYIVVFYQWLRLETDSAAKEKILDFAVRFMRPKHTLANNPEYNDYLPKYDDIHCATRCILANLKRFEELRLIATLHARFADNVMSFSLSETVEKATSTPSRLEEKQTNVDCLKLESNSYPNTIDNVGRADLQNEDNALSVFEKHAKSKIEQLSNSEHNLNHEEPSISILEVDKTVEDISACTKINSDCSALEPTNNQLTVVTNVQLTTTTTTNSQNLECLVSNYMVMSTAVYNNLNENEIEHALERFQAMAADDSCNEYSDSSQHTNTPASRTSNESTSILYVNPALEPAPINGMTSLALKDGKLELEELGVENRTSYSNLSIKLETTTAGVPNVEDNAISAFYKTYESSKASSSDESGDSRSLSFRNVSPNLPASSSYSNTTVSMLTTQSNDEQLNQTTKCEQSYSAYHNKILKLRRDLVRRKALIRKLLRAAFEQSKKAKPQRKLMIRAYKDCRQAEKEAKFESQQCRSMPKAKSLRPQIAEVMMLKEYLHEINRILKLELTNLDRQLIVIRQCTDKAELKKLKKKICKLKLRRDRAKNTLMSLLTQCGTEKTFQAVG